MIDFGRVIPCVVGEPVHRPEQTLGAVLDTWVYISPLDTSRKESRETTKAFDWLRGFWETLPEPTYEQSRLIAEEFGARFRAVMATKQERRTGCLHTH